MTDAERRARSRCKEHEGLRLQSYRDTLGVQTVGIGHRVTKADCDRWGVGPRDHDGLTDKLVITQEEAHELFEKDWANARDGAEGLCRAVGIEPLDEDPPPHDLCRFFVLVEMAFQLGHAGLGKFRNMWAALGRGDPAEAALHALDSRWLEQTPRRARRLAMILWKGHD